MLHRRNEVRNDVQVSPDEVRTILEQRLQALEDATCLVTLGDPMPIPWRVGWRASVAVVGRDRDGSLFVEIRVTGPQLRETYVRRVRLVRAERLSRGRG